MFTGCAMFCCLGAKKGSVGMSKEELTLEKRRELEKRLQDVSGHLNSVKKPAKPKGERRSRPQESTSWLTGGGRQEGKKGSQEGRFRSSDGYRG